MMMVDRPVSSRTFSKPMLEVLFDRKRWWLIASGIPREVQPVNDRRHEKWMRNHSHKHTHTEIMFVLKGRGSMGYEKRIYPYGPGTVFCFQPGESHDLEIPVWGQETEMLWIVLMGRKFVAQVTQFRPDLPGGAETMGFIVLAKDTGLLEVDPMPEQWPDRAPRREVRALQLYAAVETLVAALVEQGDAPVHPREEQVRERVVRMMQEYMEETGGQGLTPAELARMSGYSRAHFMRLFRQQVGCTVLEYLNQCRLRRAHELEKRGYQQYRIADILGFSCPTSYCRWRRQQEGKRAQAAVEGAEEEKRSGEVKARIL
ncbi:MAG: AraC family transcriptional regulator [Armatimonadia bacterium]